MKFSYRVGGIIVLGLVAVIVLGRMSLWYWDRTPSVKHISTDRPTREPLLQESKGTRETPNGWVVRGACQRTD